VAEKRPDPVEVARLLRQRTELGGSSLFLEGLDRAEAIALAASARQAPRASRPGTGSEEPTSKVGASQARRDEPVAKAAGADAPTSLTVLPTSYQELRSTALECTRCRLSETRTQVVFSDGAVDARLVVVGEAPGANEDATGLPFVGAAGRFLDLLLACVELSREETVYICNVLKCRPPGNRNPMPDEIEACSPFLERQLELIAPQAMLAVGTFAAQALTGLTRPLGKLRGTVHAYRGVPLVVTYHPAALLRNAGWTRAVWDDLQLLRRVMDSA
jgi:uracil-DNA glycosylase family 4